MSDSDPGSVVDKTVVIFRGSLPPEPRELAPGEIELNTRLFDRVAKAFGRKIDEVEQDWTKTVRQVTSLVEKATQAAPKDLKVSSIEVGLGFTASGSLAFIAEAGIEATVKLVFTA
jgi:hypothetical protein